MLAPAIGSAQTSHSWWQDYSIDPNVVSGLPYSAVMEIDDIWISADGTRREVENQRRMYRDSKGSMRIDLFLPWEPTQNGPETVVIIDLAHTEYLLEPKKRIARIVRPWPPIAPQPADNATSAPTSPDDVDLYLFARQTQYSEKTEDLGTQMMDGLLVRGKLTTSTLPSGSEGDRPTLKVDEVWTSTDLGIAILRRHLEPPNYESVTHVTNLERSEPDPALFRIPSDYALQDAP
jgi:hypothetical protein